jgi:hypothetical protein
VETENLIRQDPQDALQAVERKRLAARLRKQAQRDRDKIKKQTAKAAEHIEKELLKESLNLSGMAREDVGEADVIRRGLCFLGEVAPGRDGKNIHEALYSARTFARAMHEPDVILGKESLKDFECRIFHAWKNFKGFANSKKYYFEDGSAPFLNMLTGQLVPGWGGGMFSWDKWIHLPGADKVLTPEQIRESGTL